MTHKQGYQIQVNDDDSEIINTQNVNENQNPSPVSPKEPKKCCLGEGFKVIVAGSIIFTCVIIITFFVDRNQFKTRAKENYYTAITDAEECTKIAQNILRMKGNAIDSAIASMFCLTVVRPDQISLAGGGIMHIHSARSDQVLDFQFALPYQTAGKQSVAVPLLLDGLKLAHSKYGSLDWKDLITPSITLSSKGFALSNKTAQSLQDKNLPSTILDLFKLLNRTAKAGDWITLPVLTNTLLEITKNLDNFKRDVILKVTSQNFSMSLNDFLTNKPMIKNALISQLSGFQISSAPPSSSSGVLLLSALNILQNLSEKNLSVSYTYIIDTLQIVSSKINLLEQATNETTRQSITNMLLSAEFAKNSSEEIKSHFEHKLVSKNITKRDNLSSCKVIVMDKDDTTVTIIGSLGTVFGSKMVTDGGVILNDGLDAFNSEKTTADPKQLFSYMAPAVASYGQGKVVHAFASSPDIDGLAAVLQVLWNVICMKLEPTDAIQRPRVMFDDSSQTVRAEGDRFTSAGYQYILEYLKTIYKDIDYTKKSIGSVIMASKTEEQSFASYDQRDSMSLSF